MKSTRMSVPFRLLAIGGTVGALVTAVFPLAASTPAAATPTWSIDSSPNNGTDNNHLSGVSCPSAMSCWAVGDYRDTTLQSSETLVESWNGTGWTVTPSPNPGLGNELYGVSCFSSTSCAAVGKHGNEPLIERWKGTKWVLVSSPHKGMSSVLGSVSCVSAKSCTAVGTYDSAASGHQQTLIESWNGSTWSVVPSPNGSTFDNLLSAVSCVSATSCKAVGHYVDGNNNGETLIERWNGRKWSIVPSPNAGSTYNELSGVSCVSTSWCKAVGIYYSAGTYLTLVESWNGRVWSIDSSPSEGNGMIGLAGLSCMSVTQCKAVGYYAGGPSDLDQTLIESWDGETWSIDSSPNEPGNNSLGGVSCASATACKAVGYVNHSPSPPPPDTTLIESYG
jgi:hypothetical protein